MDFLYSDMGFKKKHFFQIFSLFLRIRYSEGNFKAKERPRKEEKIYDISN